ncbi:NAD/NADP-dependent octopine/nopaline dehydrogenase family protein [Pseudacidovorax intermedius]|uniref:Opine dehydrogenase n=1 Tax=Pseudacidovorax intermedius TaxID=433924 RepID=A0A370FFP5_9BURK|nr:NAD/NADP-dependent octopine/nopaline dehydrogenase family protein [Pseudacidovorax intermedius]RDI25246.1 opine dehydrogenase [Pseudacidovorax intermedius]
MRIAVLGGGHGCYAAAADLSEAGHEVRLWRRDAQALQPVVEAGSIRLKDATGARDVPIALATADIGQALRDAELIVVPVPATAQADIARAMAPHLVDGQVVFLPPGTFGSVVMARIVRECGNRADVAWAETGTLPYLARKHGEREVNVTIRAIRLPTGVYPARHAERAIAVIRGAYPAVHGCGDALSGALMNAGPIIHPPLMVMNAAPLQHFERWDIHNEGTQRAVREVTDRLDQERIAVREAFGQGAPHYPLADHYDNDQWMYGDAHKQLVKSGDWRENIDLYGHRYITEDTELGLAFLASAARHAGVDAPIAHGLLAIVGGFLGRDLRQGPRSFEALGLSSLSREALAKRLQDGE